MGPVSSPGQRDGNEITEIALGSTKKTKTRKGNELARSLLKLVLAGRWTMKSKKSLARVEATRPETSPGSS